MIGKVAAVVGALSSVVALGELSIGVERLVVALQGQGRLAESIEARLLAVATLAH